jgi:hypothetical protein
MTKIDQSYLVDLNKDHALPSRAAGSVDSLATGGGAHRVGPRDCRIVDGRSATLLSIMVSPPIMFSFYPRVSFSRVL